MVLEELQDIGLTLEEIQAELRKEARRALWEKREVWPLLEVYLDRDQFADIKEFFRGCDVDKAELPRESWVDDISRQRGKSFKWCVVAVVWAHCHAGQFIKYAAQLGVSVRGIIRPTINKLLEDIPEELRPTEDKVDHVWTFSHDKGNSEIKAAGVNLGHYDDLRGPKTHIVIQDECAFYDDFDRVQEAIHPGLSTVKGVSVYATTPPYSPNHPYEKTRVAHKAIGRYVHRTIYNHPRMSPEDIDQHLTQVARSKGQTLEQFKQSSFYRREYLCMHIVETSKAVCPEWSAPAGPNYPEGMTWGTVLTKKVDRPVFYYHYDSLDIGFTRDPSAWIGGYWDFEKARLVIEGETEPQYHKRADELAVAIKAERVRLWPTKGPNGESLSIPAINCKVSEDGTYYVPYGSVGDGSGNGAEKLNELAKEGLFFHHAEKPDLESRVSAVRTLVSQGKLVVSPDCPNLLKQLEMGLWANKTARNDFERTEEGHLDFFAALVDLVEFIDRSLNPIPLDYGKDLFNTVVTHHTPKTKADKALEDVLGDIQW